MIRMTLACMVLLLTGSPALADTAAGVAALDRGDYAAAITELKPEAEKGDPAAQAKYGMMLAKGLGIARDAATAVGWFRKSAAQNHAEGQYMLGVAYDVGDAGSVDRAAAVDWYRKSAEQGFAKAQFNLGSILINGDGIPKAPEEGAAWVRKAAEQDMRDAASYYGVLSMAGIGVDQNVLAGRYWLGKAKELGHPKASADLQKVAEAIGQIEAAGAPKTEGGDGSSPERAILLPDVKTTMDGVRAEHLVVQFYFPGWNWQSQGLVTTWKHPLDEIVLVRDGGAQQTIYFDIVNWFGKLE